MFDVRTFDEITAGPDPDGLGSVVVSLTGTVGGTSFGSSACLRASTRGAVLPALGAGEPTATLPKPGHRP